MATPEDIHGHYVKVGGTRTFYDEIGEGQPIVCVHTAGASSLEYQYILPLFAKHGFHAFALDLPGHSRSYPVDWQPHRSIHDHAEFVHAFVKTLKIRKPVVMNRPPHSRPSPLVSPSRARAVRQARDWRAEPTSPPRGLRRPSVQIANRAARYQVDV